MKKSLLLLAVAATASLANAQVVVGLATSEELEAAGLGKDAVTLPGGTTIVDNEAGTFSIAYEDSWKTSTAYGGYRDVVVNGNAIKLGSGAVGSANPTFVSYEAGVMSAGAVFLIDAKKDGYMTVFTKLNPNKQYVVFEGTVTGMPYTLGWTNGTDKIHYALPQNEEGTLDLGSADAGKYFIPATKQQKDENGVLLWKNKVTGEIIAAEKNPTVKGDDNMQFSGVMEDIPGQSKPQMPWIVAGCESAPKENTGFLTFNVLAGNQYYVSALGSKACIGGFVYTEVDPKVVFSAYEEIDKETGEVKASYPEIEFQPLLDPTAVESIEAAADENAPVYNMLGVRVNADAKGILIQNGKKFIRK